MRVVTAKIVGISDNRDCSI